jgi:hypothetical protein
MGVDKHDRRWHEIASLNELVDSIKCCDDLVKAIKDHRIDLDLIKSGLRKEIYALKYRNNKSIKNAVIKKFLEEHKDDLDDLLLKGQETEE